MKNTNEIKLSKLNKIKFLRLDNEKIDDFEYFNNFRIPINYKRRIQIINDWNTILDSYDDDLQTIYLELHKLIANKFIFGHLLIDGNKRIHKTLSDKISYVIENNDLI